MLPELYTRVGSSGHTCLEGRVTLLRRAASGSIECAFRFLRHFLFPVLVGSDPPHSFAMLPLKHLVSYAPLALYNLCVLVTAQSSSSTSSGSAPSPTGDLGTILEREFTYIARAQTNVSQIPAW